MVEIFPQVKRKPGENYTAPIVSRSPIAGKGLFATRDYNAKEVVTLYLGKHLTYEEAKVTEDSRYLAQFNGHLVIDGKEGWQGDHGLGRFCNGAPKDSKPSVSFHPYYEEKSATPILRVVAKRAIKRGQEITAVYGNTYYTKNNIKQLPLSDIKKVGRPMKTERFRRIHPTTSVDQKGRPTRQQKASTTLADPPQKSKKTHLRATSS